MLSLAGMPDQLSEDQTLYNHWSPLYELEMPIPCGESRITRRLLDSSRRRNETAAMRRFWLNSRLSTSSNAARLPQSAPPLRTPAKLSGEPVGEIPSFRSPHRRRAQTPVTNITKQHVDYTSEKLPQINDYKNAILLDKWMKEIKKDVPDRPSFTTSYNYEDFFRPDRNGLASAKSELFYTTEKMNKNCFNISPEWNSEKPDWGFKARNSKKRKMAKTGSVSQWVEISQRFPPHEFLKSQGSWRKTPFY